MKVAVIGNGNVGMATFRELQKLREIRELVIIGRDQEKLKGEIDDFLDADVLSTVPTCKLSYGGYDKTAGADILIYTAGARQKPGQTRLDLVETNAQLTRDIFNEIKRYNPDPIVIVLSNPVDIITAVIRETMGGSRMRIIGTGTLLDTARLKRYVASMFDVSPHSTEMFVLGEHGDSSCVIWSSVRILGMTLDEYLSMEVDAQASTAKNKISEHVRMTAGRIIAAKGYTAYGVAAAAGRVVSAILHDTHEILPVSIQLEGEYGVRGLAITVPCMLGDGGVIGVKQMKLTDEEKEAFMHSARILQETAASVGLHCSVAAVGEA